jgi:hypothetical protein
MSFPRSLCVWEYSDLAQFFFFLSRKMAIGLVLIQRKGSYTPHPYIYTLTPTFDANYQVYPLYKIKHNQPFTHSPHLFLEKTEVLLEKTLPWLEKTIPTISEHSLPNTFPVFLIVFLCSFSYPFHVFFLLIIFRNHWLRFKVFRKHGIVF